MGEVFADGLSDRSSILLSSILKVSIFSGLFLIQTEYKQNLSNRRIAADVHYGGFFNALLWKWLKSELYLYTEKINYIFNNSY